MRTCPFAAENTKDDLSVKNDFLSFQGTLVTYIIILQVMWTKAKLFTSNFVRILCIKNYPNRYIFD